MILTHSLPPALQHHEGGAENLEEDLNLQLLGANPMSCKTEFLFKSLMTFRGVSVDINPNRSCKC